MHNNFSKVLNQCGSLLQDTIIYASDFSFIEPEANDFVYFDPPYHKSGESFDTKVPFSEIDQIRLRDFAKALNNKGVKFMISNSNTNFIRRLYDNFNINDIEVRYSMPHGISDDKTVAKELLITNY